MSAYFNCEIIFKWYDDVSILRRELRYIYILHIQFYAFSIGNEIFFFLDMGFSSVIILIFF